MRPLLAAFLILLFVGYAVPATAQTPEDEVRATIDNLFDGMRAGDSTAVRATFHDNATIGSSFTRQGTPVLHAGSVDAFVNAVGTPHEQVWDEKIWDFKIHVRDNLAVAWMDYAFFLDDQLSHCGVNSFQLVRTEDGWKTVHIIDTRQQEGCEVPDGE
jgi:hypothetical protein